MKFKCNMSELYVSLSKTAIDEMISICQSSHPNETGGIIIGYYSTDLKGAYIVEATTKTKDSTYGRSWFNRGIYGLRDLLIKRWLENKYYIGEWHFHPDNSPIPSSVDIHQMKKISKDGRFKCPEPILVIIGQEKNEFTLSVQMLINDDFEILHKIEY